MKVVFINKAHKQLLKLPRPVHDLIVLRIKNLIGNTSSNIKKLTNREGWRLRIGDYRVIYTISKQELVVLSVAHRKDAYRK